MYIGAVDEQNLHHSVLVHRSYATIVVVTCGAQHNLSAHPFPGSTGSRRPRGNVCTRRCSRGSY